MKLIRVESATPLDTPVSPSTDLAPITYPDIAIRAGVSGAVQIKFVVEEDGTTDSVYVWRGIGAGCDEVAHSAIENATFLPGRTADGTAVRSSATAHFRFSLRCSE